jgi:hypothetical protein
MTFLNAQTMFLLSLDTESRDRMSELVNEAVQLMSSGLPVCEIEKRLEDDLKLLESGTPTPRMVRNIVLGGFGVDSEESGTTAISTQAPAM